MMQDRIARCVACAIRGVLLWGLWVLELRGRGLTWGATYFWGADLTFGERFKTFRHSATNFCTLGRQDRHDDETKTSWTNRPQCTQNQHRGCSTLGTALEQRNVVKNSVGKASTYMGNSANQTA